MASVSFSINLSWSEPLVGVEFKTSGDYSPDAEEKYRTELSQIFSIPPNLIEVTRDSIKIKFPSPYENLVRGMKKVKDDSFTICEDKVQKGTIYVPNLKQSCFQGTCFSFKNALECDKALVNAERQYKRSYSRAIECSGKLSEKCETMIRNVEAAMTKDSSIGEVPRKVIEALVARGYPEPTEVYCFEESVDVVWYDPHVDITIAEDCLSTTRRSSHVLCLEDIISSEFDLPQSDISSFIVEKSLELFSSATENQLPKELLERICSLDQALKGTDEFYILVFLHRIIQRILPEKLLLPDEFEVSVKAGRLKWRDADLVCTVENDQVCVGARNNKNLTRQVKVREHEEHDEILREILREITTCLSSPVMT